MSLPPSGIRTGAGVVPVVHIVPEVRSDDRMHVMDSDDCWCRPWWVFEGDGKIRIVHRRIFGEDK